MTKNQTLSIVIPTYNRPQILIKTLSALAKQTYPINETLVVDSSSVKLDPADLKRRFPMLHICYIESEASVCIQRNKGIQRAKSNWIFLCDDDVEAPPDYIAKLMCWLSDHPGEGAVTGLFKQRDEQGQWQVEYSPKSFKKLVWQFVFQSSIWGRLNHIRSPLLGKPFFAYLSHFYARRANDLSLAGWPLITQWQGSYIKTTVYTLGASIVKRDWLNQSPFDEVLDANGIGDNYGVALGFPKDKRINILKDAYVYHHKSTQNRMAACQSNFRRVLALDYFMRTHPRFSWGNRIAFKWSLIGHLLIHLSTRNGPEAKATWKAMRLVLLGRNPYLIASKKGEKVCQVQI